MTAITDVADSERQPPQLSMSSTQKVASSEDIIGQKVSQEFLTRILS
jgi:hypothetical protein